MNEGGENVVSVLAIAEEMKRSFNAPVILLTMKDFADGVFDTLVQLRTEQLRHAAPDCIIGIIHDFHQAWLHAVEDAENFKWRIKDTPRNSIINKAIDFTINCADKRLKYFQKYVVNLKDTLSEKELVSIQADIETMEETNASLKNTLVAKQMCLSNLVDQSEFYYKVVDETEELLNWLDGLSDGLAIQFSNITGIKFPNMLTVDLRKTLQSIVDEISNSSNEDIQNIVDEIQRQGEFMSGRLRLNTISDLELSDLVLKIQTLEERIKLLKRENSVAVVALEHKTNFLRDKLHSLELLQNSLRILKEKNSPLYSKGHEGALHVFDHLLPAKERMRLVEELMTLWNEAIVGGQEKKSIISILSVAEIKETYSDDLGKTTVEKNGRKLYQMYNEKKFPLNDINNLVSDDKHVFFYDECGRYYIHDKKYRVYKAHEDASEYVLNVHGLLVKTKETRQGINYYYDRLGRYYVDDSGKQIYLGEDNRKYEADTLGNLVLLRDPNFKYHYCRSTEAIAVEETKYLQETVGEALKKCIADVICHRPSDPILYLAECLEKYGRLQQEQARRREERAALEAERERLREKPAPCLSYVQDEQNIDDADIYFRTYVTPDILY